MIREVRDFILSQLGEDFNLAHGALIMYEHQLTLPPELRRMPPEVLEEEAMRTLRMYKASLQMAIEELNKLETEPSSINN